MGADRDDGVDLLFFINRAGSGLARARRAELLRAKRILQGMIAVRRTQR